MKHLIFFLLTCCLFSCDKGTDDIQEPGKIEPMGQATMLLNEKSATFAPFMFYSYGTEETIELNFREYTPSGLLTKEFSISKLPVEVGKYELVRRIPDQSLALGATSFYTTEHDILNNAYHLNEQDDIEDFIEFTEINEVTREVKGNFQASFYVDTLIQFDATQPDTLIITNGYFETILQDRP